MATDDSEDLRLNTLHRFQKQSPRLTLQVHSHCEVPAGCGGVVLRWVDPNAGFGAVLQVAPGEGTEAWIDGGKVSTTRLDLPYGEHLLALRLVPVGVTVGSKRPKLLGGRAQVGRPFVCAVASDAPSFPRVPPATATSRDGWRASTVPPSADWLALGFDDREWITLGPCPVALDRLDQKIRWQFERLVQDASALPLDLPDAPEVFIRHRFQVVRR